MNLFERNFLKSNYNQDYNKNYKFVINEVTKIKFTNPTNSIQPKKEGA